MLEASELVVLEERGKTWPRLAATALTCHHSEVIDDSWMWWREFWWDLVLLEVGSWES